MKSISQTIFFAVLSIVSTFANASDVRAKLSLAMELKEGETTIGKPRIIVVSGEQGSIAVGSNPAATAIEPGQQYDYRIAVLPTLEATGELLTAYDVTVITPLSDKGASNIRTVKLKIKQMPGEAITIKIPGGDGEQPLNLKVKTDIVS